MRYSKAGVGHKAQLGAAVQGGSTWRHRRAPPGQRLLPLLLPQDEAANHVWDAGFRRIPKRSLPPRVAKSMVRFWGWQQGQSL